MTLPVNEIESVLAIDIGSVNTRAVLFDLAGNSYRMLSAAIAPSTHMAPIRDVQEGMATAVRSLEEITGRTLLDSNQRLIIPSSAEGEGVDHLALTSSAGPDIRIAAIGLLDSYSMAAVEKLAGGIYARVVDRVSLGDNRKPEDRLNTFIQSNPDLVILAGGTNHGASRAVLRMADQLRLGLQSSPVEERPPVLFAGNEVLNDRVKEMLEPLTRIHLGPNVMPGEIADDTGPVEDSLVAVINGIRAKTITGFNELEKSSGQPTWPSAGAEGRIIRFQSLQQDPMRTVTGVNVGASASHFITAADGELQTVVYRGLGVGQAAAETLSRLGIDAITRWLSMDIPQSDVKDYLWQKSLFPAGLPATAETLEIEQAVARAILSEMRRIHLGMPSLAFEGFEPILASGAVIAQAPNMIQSLLMILDGLQPTGVTTVLCDRFGLLTGLGVTAPINPALVVQVLETGVVTNIGTVISPTFRARIGEPVLRVRLQEEEKDEKEFEIAKGEIVRLPLGVNKPARLILKPMKHMGSFSGSKNLKVIGGELGVIIDTRGRTISLPSDNELRRDVLTRWNNSLQECLS